MKARWTAPTTFTDGSAFGRTDLAGFELQLDDRPAVSVPFTWNDAGKYEFDLGELELQPGRQYSARMLTVATGGRKSDWTAPVLFTYARTPRAPLAFAVG
ncbi:MAG: hypothetical protein M3Y79_09275 [Pseudomonadota bacterium]|nr:hypothetical protein [Pseudomonadota bacterium]